MLWKARDRGLLNLHLHDIRDYSTDKHRTVDDTPYGGGGGMVLKPDVVVRAVEQVRGDSNARVILMTPQGRLLNHAVAVELSQHVHLILVCGHYEGFDERIRLVLQPDEISIGDYVLTGGELAAMVVIDAVIRHIPGVLGAEGGQDRDSHADGLLEGPHYTRPPEFRGFGVPDVLRNGNHAEIQKWRRLESIKRTWHNRPDLLLKAELTEEERYYLAELAEEKTGNHESGALD
jgi:tRNA (guanine37-N1)-methyltransferase